MWKKNATRTLVGLVFIGVAPFCSHRIASAETVGDFSELTSLAQGALFGENVDESLDGFEIQVTHRGQTVYHQSFGDWSLNRIAKGDSTTKTLSGALMMSVADSGDSGFSLDSRLSDHLLSFRQPVIEDITIRQAFTHTSGMQNGVDSLILRSRDLDLRQAAALIAAQPLDNGPPGSRFHYGSFSMHSAGAAVEAATDQAYVDLFSNRITDPLGMTDTSFRVASDTNPRVAGGIDTTASDYSRFMDMLLNDGVDRVTGEEILSIGAVEEMLSLQIADDLPLSYSPNDNHRYGIGVWVDQLNQHSTGVDVLAAGRSGFHSWIDKSNELVFTFSTDLTRFENVEELSSRMHAATLNAIAVPEPSLMIPLLASLSVISAYVIRARRSQVNVNRIAGVESMSK